MSEAKEIVYSRDGEIFRDDESILKEAKNDWMSGEPLDGGYYSGERKDIGIENLVSDIVVEDILNDMESALYDIIGEVAEDALSMSDEKKEELRDIITKFIVNNCSCSCFAVENIKYHSFLYETNDCELKMSQVK